MEKMNTSAESVKGVRLLVLSRNGIDNHNSEIHLLHFLPVRQNPRTFPIHDLGHPFVPLASQKQNDKKTSVSTSAFGRYNSKKKDRDRPVNLSDLRLE